MRSSRAGYVMAMMAGLTIVGASTGGAVIASSHHEQTVSAAASVTQSTSDTPASPGASAGTVAAETATPVASTPVSSQVAERPAPAGSTPVVSTVMRPAAPAATAPTPRSPAGPTTAETSAPANGAPKATTAPAASLEFKDGKYSATGSYSSPGGTEKLGVTVTIAADKVTTSDLDLQGGAGLSHSFQSAFESGYSSQVIGKKIDTISLGAVSGSSLTGMGFNEALKQIESAARLQK